KQQDFLLEPRKGEAAIENGQRGRRRGRFGGRHLRGGFSDLLILAAVCRSGRQQRRRHRNALWGGASPETPAGGLRFRWRSWLRQRRRVVAERWSGGVIWPRQARQAQPQPGERFRQVFIVVLLPLAQIVHHVTFNVWSSANIGICDARSTGMLSTPSTRKRTT